MSVRLYGRNQMQVVQTLETININTDDISIFYYFKNLITKNFSKVIGRKNKIFSFFEESEIPQRKYFLKVLNKKYLSKKYNTKILFGDEGLLEIARLDEVFFLLSIFCTGLFF